MSKTVSRPFLKWAGGKHRHLAYLRRALPKGSRLVEPFVGSGAVFMGTDYPTYLLADNNGDLIDLYMVLRDEGAAFIDECRRYFTQANNSEAKYYNLRERFNEINIDPSEAVEIERCALFVYLNRHCYNGLCRYNSSGGFNVPFGRYSAPYFPLAEMQAFHQKSNERDVEFIAASFRDTMTEALPGDVIYCDPPFLPPQNAQTHFSDYTSAGFDLDDHRLLAVQALLASDIGATVLIQNHSAPVTNLLYRNNGARLGFRKAARTINSNAANRKPTVEVSAWWRPKEAA
jgi:DNA adenine methylase